MFKIGFASDTQEIEVQDVGTGVSFAENTWYQVRILIFQGDVTAATSYANFYVDGELIAGDIAAGHYGGFGISTIVFSGGSNLAGIPSNDHYSYIDNLSIAVEPLEPTPAGVIGFEASGIETPGFDSAGGTGNLDGQNGWSGVSATIINRGSLAYMGDQYLRLGHYNNTGGNATTPPINDDPNEGGMMIEFMLNHGERDPENPAGDSYVEVDAEDGYPVFRVIFSSEDKMIRYGNLPGTETGFSFEEETWYRVRLLVDKGDGVHGGMKARVYIDDQLVARNIASLHYVSTGVKSIKFVGGSSLSPAVIDDTYDHYTRIDNLTWYLADVPAPIVGDLDDSGTVDTADLGEFGGQWLNCTEPGDTRCDDLAHTILSGTADVDGDLSDWDTHPEWISLDKTYYGNAADIADARMALRWDGETDRIYVAVILTDTAHYFGDCGEAGYGVGWDNFDVIEVYSQGDAVGGDYSNVINKNAQYYLVGATGDETSGYGQRATWPTCAALGGVEDPCLQYAVVVDGDEIVYELGIVQYDEFAGTDGSGSTTVTQLDADDVVRFDLIVDSRWGTNAGDFGMLAENLMELKPWTADDFQQYRLVTSPACGDWGYYDADFDHDCIVNLRDFSKIAANWLKSED